MIIGLIDSGIGGFSILRATQKALPHHMYVYLADQANFPYSQRSTKNLIELAKEHARVLIEKHNCSLIVLACNTLSVAALAAVRTAFPDTRFIGTVPPVNVAAKSLGNDANILVLSSERTAKSEYLQQLLENLSGPNWEILGSTDLVEAIEAGDAAKVKQVLTAIRDSYPKITFSGIVLGCTHFPLVANEMQETWPDAELFSPSDGVVKQLKQISPVEPTEQLSSTPLFLTTPDYSSSLQLEKRYHATL
ncbi:MAG: glutamate racemase [Candidatus Pacebacteria bacterium]|nr:glutamate racemase [Candidatus Paceibacterota bacterium]PIR61210.1 MAG: glutamate racemase [Candidatus Pacebacteria bacterium CG10_big_fil_rev_8_21_14_0_10_45_6]